MKLRRFSRLAALRAGLVLACFLTLTATRADIGYITPEGLQLAQYLDSFQVQHWWLPVAVNWQTGSPNTPIGTSGNNDFVVSTHCSCFVPAAANPLGIYILRSPEHSWSNLANAQDTWYPSAEGVSYGWVGIPKTSTNGMVAQSLANQGNFVVAVYLSTSGSGHTAVIHPFTNTAANIMSVGAAECQSGTYNYNLTNVSTGFNQHPGAFPSGIDYFYHTVTYPISAVTPIINSLTLTNGILHCQVSSLVGRNYKLQTTTDFNTWTTALNFTNSNLPITLYTTTNLAIPAPSACVFGIHVADPYGIVSQVVTQSSAFTGITLNGSAIINIILGTPFTDPGANAIENCSTNLAITTIGSVNVNAVGAYPITYKATTSSGIQLVATRVVNVNASYQTTTTLTSSANPINEGQPLIFTATVSTPGSSPSGSVTFMNGSAILGTTAVSNKTAMLTTSGGAGIYSISATYSGDPNNGSSLSGSVSQIIQSGGGSVAVGPAMLLQDGQDYAVASSTPITGRGAWVCGGGTGSTSFIKIVTNDLAGATVPDLRPLTNSVNPPAKLQVSKAGSASRWYYRSLTNNVTSGAVYFSFLLNVATNPTTSDEFMGSMLAGGGNSTPAPTDPMTLHARKGADGNHFDLGIERLNGTTSWTGDLTDNSTYLVVLKYSFGSSARSCLFVNPTPGVSEPVPAVTAASDGITPEPASIGTVLFYEGGSGVPYLTSGTYQYDVLRADTNWYAITPAAGTSVASLSGATRLIFSSAPQTISANENSALITVTLTDQSNNVFQATADTLVNLNSDSDGSDAGRGIFLSGTDGATVITSVIISNGTSTATFYYNDGVTGNPTITATSGLLTAATQVEAVKPVAPNGQILSVSGNGPYQVNMTFYGVPGAQYHVQRSTDLRVWTTPGDAIIADSSGVIHYTDSGESNTRAYYRLAYP